MNHSDINNTNIYARKAVLVQGGIPIFSRKDDYVENYEKIASDHVLQITKTQENPFMEEELWVSLEESTRAYIRKHVSKGSRILDVGVGLGRLLEPLTEYQRFGMDISLDYLAIAKQRGIEVAMSKIEDMPYHANFFDAIIVCDVLEHVLDLNYCCEKILSCLRPGGVLIVRVPFKEDLEAYLNEDLPYEFIHLRNFDEASLRLHFQKIFNLQFIESAPTTPYLQGTPRLKLRLLPEKSCAKLTQMLVDRPELAPITNALKVSEEAFQAWIYDLKDNSRTLFNDISEDFILGIEINAVFIKPFSERASRRILREWNSEASLIYPASQEYTLAELGGDFMKFKHVVNGQLIKVNQELGTVEVLIESKFKDVNERLETLFENQNQALASIEETLSAPSDSLCKKLVKKFRRFFKFSY